jgi:hypothetical protein
MAIRDDFAPGETLLAADLNDTFASKPDLSGATYTGTHDFRSAAVLGASGLQELGGFDLTGSNVAVNNVFTSSYLNYLLLIDSTLASAGALRLLLRASGSNATSNYFTQRVEASSTSVTSDRNATTANFNWNISAIDNANASIFVYKPFVAAPTFFHATGAVSSSTTAYWHFGSGGNSNSTSYDGFELNTSGPNFSGGRVRVFGFYN